MITNFKGLVISEKNNSFHCSVKERTIDDLPEGDLLIKVVYSSLNYKDALSATGNKGVTRKYPHTPGIDAVGIIKKSKDNNFPVNSSVIVSGYDLGMNTSGGFSEYIRVPSKWAILKPNSLSSKDTMIIGTAGLTAGLCIKTLEENKSINGIKAVVSGASGGVGCIAVKLLSKLGANVTAITGKNNSHNFLKNLGAQQIIDRKEFLGLLKRPLGKGLWDAAIDVVGGNMLSTILGTMKYEGIITCCGLVEDPNFKTSVFPFILRANQLIGIDSAETSITNKKNIWKLFSHKWKLKNLEELSHTVKLEGMYSEIKKILSGKQHGRVILKL